MTREFPDEFLSAYLDGELSPAEQTQVEQRLATSETDRQLLGELRSLRGELGMLPGVHVDAGFADRVVRAALAAQVADVPPPLEVASPSKSRTPKWVFVAAAALAAAASLLIAVQPWRSPTPNAPTVVLSPADQLINTLRTFAPNEGQALVVRLQLSKDAAASLEAALSQAGIEALSGSGLKSVGEIYQRQIAEKLAAGSTRASEAVLVEAPLANIERALATLAGDGSARAIMSAETKLNWRKVQELEGEGEGDSQRLATGMASRPVATRLNAAQFPLSIESAPVASPTAAVPAPRLTGPTRVIILVEQLDN
jgi:hypothetical protein